MASCNEAAIVWTWPKQYVHLIFIYDEISCEHIAKRFAWWINYDEIYICLWSEHILLNIFVYEMKYIFLFCCILFLVKQSVVQYNFHFKSKMRTVLLRKWMPQRFVLWLWKLPLKIWIDLPPRCLNSDSSWEEEKKSILSSLMFKKIGIDHNMAETILKNIIWV